MNTDKKTKQSAPAQITETRSIMAWVRVFFVTCGVLSVVAVASWVTVNTLISMRGITTHFQYAESVSVRHGPHYYDESDDAMVAAVRRVKFWRKYGRDSSRRRAQEQVVSTDVGERGQATTAVPSVEPAAPSVATPSPKPAALSVAEDAVGTAFGMAAANVLPWKSQTEIDAYFALLKDLQVEWVRIDIGWNDVQSKNATEYDWSRLDRVIDTAERNGVRVLGTIAYTPRWARVSGCQGGMKCAPASSKAFATFAAAAAERYKGRVRHFEIWNEPNIALFWAPHPDVAAYVALLKETYLAIKAVDPNTVVMTAGLAPAEDRYNRSVAPITFVQSMYTHRAQGYFDAVAFHPYTYPASPSYAAEWNAWQQTTEISAIMRAEGDGEKKIWLTEFGLPTNGPGWERVMNEFPYTYGSDYMSEQSQREMVETVARLYRNSALNLGPFFWYSMQDLSTNENDPENFFGLVRADGSKKPAYEAYKKYTTEAAR